MSTRIGFCTVFKGRIGMRVEIAAYGCSVTKVMNEDQARKLLEDLQAAVLIAWPEKPEKIATEGE